MFVFTRLDLYELVWSEPMRLLAGKFNISDRGLAKACAAANIPVPERGYWNKLQAGKKVTRTALPPRGLGYSDEIVIGGRCWNHHHVSDKEVLNNPIPLEPVFEPDMEKVRQQAATMVKKAPLPKTLDRPHRLVGKLLDDDKARLEKNKEQKYSFMWDKPIFTSRFEQRRLKIINGLFICLESCGMKPSISDKVARDLSVKVGDQAVPIMLDSTNAKRQIERERSGYGFQPRGDKDKIRLSLLSWKCSSNDILFWEDSDKSHLEKYLREIAAAIIASGEEYYRRSMLHSHQCRIKRKADLEEEERQRKIEEERRQREHEERMQQERIDFLLSQAGNMHKANQIRAYVAAVGEANKVALEPMSQEEFISWKKWALAQADQIDPIVSGTYKSRKP